MICWAALSVAHPIAGSFQLPCSVVLQISPQKWIAAIFKRSLQIIIYNDDKNNIKRDLYIRSLHRASLKYKCKKAQFSEYFYNCSYSLRFPWDSLLVTWGCVYKWAVHPLKSRKVFVFGVLLLASLHCIYIAL